MVPSRFGSTETILGNGYNYGTFMSGLLPGDFSHNHGKETVGPDEKWFSVFSSKFSHGFLFHHGKLKVKSFELKY